jgi:hypothetical protein
MSRRPPGGQASGALTSDYSSPGAGLALSSGCSELDDFAATVHESRHGWLLWAVGNVQGTTSAAQATPTAATEYGLTTLTPQSKNKGGTLYRDAALPLFLPALGMMWAAKITASAVSQLEVWSGYTSSTTGRVRTADATELVGVRLNTATTEWEGIVKDGSGSGNESAISLGAAVADTYIHAGWEVVDSSGSDAVQFFVLDSSERASLERTDKGDPVTTNIPSGLLPVALGVYQTGNQGVDCTIDSWQFVGRFAR